MESDIATLRHAFHENRLAGAWHKSKANNVQLDLAYVRYIEVQSCAEELVTVIAAFWPLTNH